MVLPITTLSTLRHKDCGGALVYANDATVCLKCGVVVAPDDRVPPGPICFIKTEDA
jgi:hypothetical protein